MERTFHSRGRADSAEDRAGCEGQVRVRLQKNRKEGHRRMKGQLGQRLGLLSILGVFGEFPGLVWLGNQVLGRQGQGWKTDGFRLLKT